MSSNERQPVHPTHVINVAISGRASRNVGECVTGHVLRYLAIPPGRGAALDLPCGTGYGCQILWAKGYDPLGVDRDAYTVQTARAAYPNCRFEVADVEHFEPLQRFAVGACFEGLEHFRDPLAALERMPQWAATWYVSIPVQAPNEWHYHVFRSRDEVRRFLELGFRSVEYIDRQYVPSRVAVDGVELPVPPMWRCR